jgi:hypothetical protein
MPLLVVTSEDAGAGKTGVAAAIARGRAYTGTPVTLVRLDGGENASADAGYFSMLSFAAGGRAAPAKAADVTDPGAGALLVAEAPWEQAAALDGVTVFVVSDRLPKALPEPRPALIVVTHVPRQHASAIPPEMDGVPVVAIAEDRTLAGFSFEEARRLLNAEMLVEGEPRTNTCDHLVIAPIASDAGQPYFKRFASSAVVVRFDKTDMHLAAIRGGPEFLVLTGGRRPSDYLFDAASANGIPVLLSPTDTENTVIALERVFEDTRFQGERKLDRMCRLLEEAGLFAALPV